MTTNDQRSPAYSSDFYGDRARLREAERDQIYKEREKIAERASDEDRGHTQAEQDRLDDLAKELERLGDQAERDEREQNGRLTGEEIDRLNKLAEDEAAGKDLTPAEQMELQRLEDLFDAGPPDAPSTTPPFDPPGPDADGRMIAGTGGESDGGNGQPGGGPSDGGQNGGGQGGGGQNDGGQGGGQPEDHGGGPDGGGGGGEAYTDGDTVTGGRRGPALTGRGRIGLTDAARQRLGGVLDSADGGFAPTLDGTGPAQPGRVTGDPAPDGGGVQAPRGRDRFSRPGTDPGMPGPDDL
ncbi:hypothetical protein [Hamadaea tsunoensis]|uniref:hypothetical protein n=1 Tax=Hamadaea tsunoensis TaxID=53368 RepID=UPI00040D5360|nr:hypothetical protein [Hamadaea tsunoensis]